MEHDQNENDTRTLINDPVQRDDNTHATTNVETLMHLFKGNVGTGLLSLPLAIYHGGWIFGPLMLLFISILAVHCMHLLVGSSQHLCRRKAVPTLDYGEVMEAVLQEYGPSCMAGRHHIGSKVVNMFILITQFGFCCCYFVFMAANIREVALEYSPDGSTLNRLLSDGTNADRVIMALLSIPLCAICSIRNLDHLAPFSALANLATAISVAIIFSYLIPNLNNPVTENYPKIQSFQKFALFFGTAVFSFEGISVVLPLENNAKNPQDFPKILNGGMILVTTLYVSMGLLGYLTFGEEICGSVTLNLPNETLYASVKILYSFVIFISFAIQFYVPISFLWPSIRDKLCSTSEHMLLFEMLFRYMLVMFICALAIAIPDLGDIISLIGAMASSMLALILPPIIDQLIKSNNPPTTRNKYYLISAKNLGITLFGALGMVVGTYVSIVQLVTDLSPNANATTCIPANLADQKLWFPSSYHYPLTDLYEL